MVEKIINPTSLLLMIVIIGYLIGKIKIYNISLDISAVLIMAITLGFVMSKFYPYVFNENFNNSMSLYSKTGTIIFIAVVGFQSGACLKKRRVLKNIMFFLVGALMVIAGFTCTKLISFADVEFDNSTLLGVMCGALTSTPALSAVCEMQSVVEENAILGYGVAYLFGVVGAVLFVQRVSKKTTESFETKSDRHYKKRNAFSALVVISIIGFFGQCIGLAKIPILNVCIGDTGGVLICGIIVGCLVEHLTYFREATDGDMRILRTFGLVMFFVGNGIKAGQKLNTSISLKSFLYGAIITLASLIVGYVIARVFLRIKDKNKMFIIAGGMTSTPALSVLLKSGSDDENMSAYSLSYLGALITITIGIRFIM